MAGIGVRETLTLAGRAERARAARAFVGAVLGPGHPCGDDAELLVSEIFGLIRGGHASADVDYGPRGPQNRPESQIPLQTAE